MPSDFLKAAKKIGRLRDDLQQELEDANRESMNDLQRNVKTNVAHNDSIARGVLLNNIESKKVPSDSFIHRRVSAPYWSRSVEYGTGVRGKSDPVKNGKNISTWYPPIEDLVSWITAKGIEPREYDTRYGLAEAIQETIGEYGMWPHPFMRPAWYGPFGKRGIIREHKNAISRAIRRF